MAKTKDFDAQRDALAAVREDPDHPNAAAILETAMGSKNAYLVSVAAALIARQARAQQIDPLHEAFGWFMKDPIKRDPQCKAKTAIAEALVALGQPATSIFEQGAHHVQLEPVWGGKEDTAAGLRTACVTGLVASGDPDALIYCADLLADPVVTARETAALILGQLSTHEALPLLRLKAHVGDASPLVLAAVFTSLLALDPQDSPTFVARFLQPAHPAPIQEAAALALGESRAPAALVPLIAWAEGPIEPGLRRVAFVSIALLRIDAAWDWLLEVIEDGIEADAEHAVHALSAFGHDQQLVERVKDAGGLRMRELVEALFAPSLSR